jgi:hypothetical protein
VNEDTVTITINRIEASWLAEYAKVELVDDVIYRMAKQAESALKATE